ncbi:MAG: topoisomerase C-terminal repeat-containing protein [Gammaproteobacteria bacterium]|nr:topoisomerase C-terminal repeat-containing protein [Gammaproteobacteria bacterium]
MKQKFNKILIFFIGCWFCLWCTLGLLLAVLSNGVGATGHADIFFANVTKLITFISAVLTAFRMPKLLRKTDNRADEQGRAVATTCQKQPLTAHLSDEQIAEGKPQANAFINGQSFIGLCPKCKSEVLEGSTGYFCRGGCDFRLNGVIMGQILNSLQISKLLQNGRTDFLSGFVSENGRHFSAWLVVDEFGNLQFDYPKVESNCIQVILVTNDDGIWGMIEESITGMYKNVSVKSFLNGSEAWQALRRENPDILITMDKMQGLSGEELVERLTEKRVQYPIIVTSGWPPTQEWVKKYASANSQITFLNIPFTNEQFHKTLADLLGTRLQFSKPTTVPVSEKQ